MKPLLLRLQAFGPYAGEQLVDFRDAVDAGLFGIYGDTGAGKSTIFSGICFALFGESAQPDQKDAKSLRSDFSDGDVPTEVGFIFSLGTKQYHIMRRPVQERPKRKGEGVTSEGASAWFFDATGMPVGDISATNPGKVVVEKKVSAVNSEIGAILGYNAEQFRKIVLLPQGKFETFLKANTSEKMKTLSELFDVTVYKRLAEELLERAKLASKDIEEEEIGLNARLAGDGFSSKEALEEGIEAQKGLLKERGASVKAAVAVRDTAGKALKAAEAIEAKFTEQADAKRALEVIEAQSAQMDEKAKKLEAAKKAGTLTGPEDIVRDRRRAQEAAATALETSQSRLKDAVAAAATAASQFADANEDAKAVKGLVEKRARYEDALPKYQAADECAARLNIITDQVQSAVSALKAKEENRDKLLADADALRKDKQEAGKRVHELELARGRLETTKSQLDVAQKYESAEANLEAARTEAGDAEKAETAARAALEAKQSAFDAVELELTEVQRIRLAEKLSNGDPCPVCGSLDHPAPATGTAHATGAGRAFEQVREERNKAREALSKAAAAMQTRQALVADRTRNLAAMAQPTAMSNSLQVRLFGIRATVEELSKGKSLETIEQAIATLGSQPEDAGKAVKEAAQQLGDLKVDQAAERAVFEAAREGLPADAKSKEDCRRAIKETEQQIEGLEKAKEDARAKKETADQAVGGAREALRGAEKTKADSAAGYDEAVKGLETAIYKLGFSADEYRTARQDLGAIEALENVLTGYGEDLAVAKDRKARADKAIKNKERPALTGLKAAFDAAAADYDAKLEERGRAEEALKKLQGLFGDVVETIKRIDDKRQEIAPIVNISKACNGTNLKKITLETYALGVMFQQVLKAANHRLGPMSRGRYRFEHASGATGGHGKRGLDIDVFDAHTGKTRPPQTLSGGETFYAALSLALGLSEVVERSSGQVQLDTIFIDEGFGSLDANDDQGTLEEVLQNLTDRSGQARVVGLISHVQRVQEAIPNGFYVRGSNEGSMVEMRN